MKKIILFIMISSILFSFAACNNKPTEETTISTNTSQEPTEETESTTNTQSTDVNKETTVPEETKPTETEPQETQPKPTETEPTETKPTETKPVETKPAEPQTVATTGVVLSNTVATMKVGDTHTFTATVSPSNATDKSVKWTTSNASIATVTNGKVTAVSAGPVTIIVTNSGGQSAKFDIVVQNKTTNSAVGDYVGYEVVSTNIPNKYICSNGQDLLTRMYGKNKVFQTGDGVVLQINMSSGTATESHIVVTDNVGCTYKVSGNKITVTYDGSSTRGRIDFKVRNANGEYTDAFFSVRVIRTDNLANSGYLEQEFRTYAANKGISYVINGTDFVEKYNGGYTWNDESLSITGCTIKGTDDRIDISGNSDWIDDVLWLIDQYAKMGFTKWRLNLQSTYCTTLAE